MHTYFLMKLDLTLKWVLEYLRVRKLPYRPVFQEPDTLKEVNLLDAKEKRSHYQDPIGRSWWQTLYGSVVDFCMVVVACSFPFLPYVIMHFWYVAELPVKSVRTVCQYLQVVNLGGQNRSSSPSDHWTNVSCMVPEIQQMQSQRSYFFLASCR